MDKVKKTYYISVQADSILLNKGDAAFEFEIEATEKEVVELQELFDGKEQSDNYAFGRAHVPWKPYHEDESNDVYDKYLLEIYRTIHRLGTPETKRHIERMNILHQFPVK